MQHISKSCGTDTDLRTLLGMEPVVRNCAGHSQDSCPWQSSAPPAIAYIVQQPLLKKKKKAEGEAATFLMQRQDKRSKLENLLYSKKSYSLEGEKSSSGY